MNLPHVSKYNQNTIRFTIFLILLILFLLFIWLQFFWCIKSTFKRWFKKGLSNCKPEKKWFRRNIRKWYSSQWIASRLKVDRSWSWAKKLRKPVGSSACDWFRLHRNCIARLFFVAHSSRWPCLVANSSSFNFHQTLLVYQLYHRINHPTYNLMNKVMQKR